MNLLEALSSIDMRGYVYIMEFKFQTKAGSKVLYKVGITTNKPIDRMLQVVRSFFMVRRYVPECRLVRFRKIPRYEEVEKELHSKLDAFRYQFNIIFNGYTEFFDVPLDVLIGEYEELVPLTKGLRYEEKCPEWCGQVITDNIVEEDESGYVTDTVLKGL